MDLLNTVKVVRGLSESEPLEATTAGEIRETALALIAAVFAGDGTFSSGGSDFLRAWFSNDCSDETNSEVIRVYLGKWPRVSSTIPWFFEQVVAHDHIHGTKCAAYVIARLRDIGEFAALADGRSKKQEEDLVLRYCRMLGQHALQSGLTTVLHDIDADAGRPDTQDNLPSESLESLMKSLASLIGLERVKQEVAALVNLIKVRQMREEQGLRSPPMTLHLVFSGSPGPARRPWPGSWPRFTGRWACFEKGN
jgi:urease gamma subunit